VLTYVEGLKPEVQNAGDPTRRLKSSKMGGDLSHTDAARCFWNSNLDRFLTRVEKIKGRCNWRGGAATRNHRCRGSLLSARQDDMKRTLSGNNSHRTETMRWTIWEGTDSLRCAGLRARKRRAHNSRRAKRGPKIEGYREELHRSNTELRRPSDDETTPWVFPGDGIRRSNPRGGLLAPPFPAQQEIGA